MIFRATWLEQRWLRRILGLALFNAALGLLLAIGFWLFQSSPARNFSSELTLSAVDATVYGFGFGLSIPKIAQWSERWTQPWNFLLLSLAMLGVAFTTTIVTESTLSVLGYEWKWDGYLFKSVGVFFIAMVIGLSVHAYEHYRENLTAALLKLRDRELDQQQSLKIAAEARLAALESRLHPHFLFNTLNSISALIAEDPSRADRMVQQLARLLRTSLDAFEKVETTVGEELSLVVDYLEIEKTRFGERLRYTVDVDEAIVARSIPPMTLQPIVENSVKFAITPRSGGGFIRIEGRQSNGTLNLQVRDDGDGFRVDQMKYGHGLHTLQQRLKAIYGDAAELSVASQPGNTVVSISIPT